MEITKETVRINKVICEKKETINVQGDMIVPDSKPDILNTINTTGNICIYKKEINEGKIRVDGNILTYIMYLADDEKNSLRGLNTTLDFSETIAIPELQIGMSVDITSAIKLIECKVLNGRKIGLKATVEMKFKVHSKEETDVVTNVNDVNIQVLSKNEMVSSLLGDGTTKTYVKENISIPTNDNLAEILNCSVNLVDKDTKVSYNKILAKTEVEVKLIYLTEDGRIASCTGKVPLVGFIDMPNIKEENTCEINYLTKNLIIKTNSVEEHSVYIEMEVEISCLAYEEKEIQVIEDMYCPGEKINFDLQQLNTISNRRVKKSVCNIREKVDLPEIGNGNIIDVVIEPNITKENKLNGKVMIEGELSLNIIFTDMSSVGINTKKIEIPFEQTIEEIDNTCKTNTEMEVGTQEFINQSGNVSANIDLNLETTSYKEAEIPAINNITEEQMEDSEDYSVIIYVVKPNDTLWKIAKKYGSTIDDIARVNGIERPEKINVGEKIYIPKYVLKRAKEPISL